MVTYLSKSDASEGFNQIIDFLNGSSIKYALTVNPNIYVSCIKQFWTTVAVKQVNDVTRLQALIDKKKVVITEATIRDALHLDDAEGVDCLPNEEIFVKLARMGYEMPSTKLTFYKAFFSIQWKFLIHTILQCMSAKRTSWNEFSSSMASAVICLSSGRKFNFSKYIFDSLVRNVDSTTKFYMYPCFLQLIIRKQVGNISTHTTKYTSPALTQKVFANMRRVGKGFFEVETPLFAGMLVEHESDAEGDTDEHVEEVNTGDAAEEDDSAAHGEVQPPSPQPQPQQAIDFLMSLLQEAIDACAALTRRVKHLEYDKRVETSDDTVMDDESNQGRMIAEMDQDDAVVLKDDKEKNKEVVDAVKDDEEEDETKPAKVQEVVDVVTTAKLITKVVTTASETVTALSAIITTAEAQVPAATTATLTAAPARVASAPSRRRKGVIIRDPEEESATSTIIPAKTKSKDKVKGILVEEPKPLNKKQQIEQDEQYARELHAELNKDIDWDEAIDHVKRKAKEDPTKETKRRKMNEVKDLKRHLQIVPNKDDDVYTEATPLARMVPVVDYEIIEINNKLYYKIIRADGTHQLYISFLTLLRNFDKEDLEALWSLVKERFSTSKPNNFSDDFLLTTLGAMFEKPDAHAQI
uniref:Xylulose kinase-1 n=1 Tax=Tanacetum cinerariifolium TaxID=118510 RepID=A0A699H6S4_TANCI|nr:hypothetical protein [Tanacetum cinerariifolium]